MRHLFILSYKLHMIPSVPLFYHCFRKYQLIFNILLSNIYSDVLFNTNFKFNKPLTVDFVHE